MQRIIRNSTSGTRREPVKLVADSSLSSTLDTGWRSITQRSATGAVGRRPADVEHERLPRRPAGHRVEVRHPDVVGVADLAIG